MRGLVRMLVPAGMLVLVSACLTGCGGPGDEKHLIPSEMTAQKALEVALTAWQNDQPVGKVQQSNPEIQVLDSHWKAGEQIAGFEILSKEEGGDGPPHFSVKLIRKDTGETELTKYVVYGKDPLWVAREEDYKHVEGM